MDPETLFERARSGDPQAWNDLLGWLRPILRAALRQRLRCPDDASEVVNDAQMLMYRNRAQFRGQSLGQFRAWARRIAANALVDHVRGQGRNFAELLGEPAAPCEPAAAPELGDELARALARLPAEQRQIVEGRIFDGMRLTEIAERLGRPPSTVRVYWKRAIQTLSAQLRGEP